MRNTYHTRPNRWCAPPAVVRVPVWRLPRAKALGCGLVNPPHPRKPPPRARCARAKPEATSFMPQASLPDPPSLRPGHTPRKPNKWTKTANTKQALTTSNSKCRGRAGGRHGAAADVRDGHSGCVRGWMEARATTTGFCVMRISFLLTN